MKRGITAKWNMEGNLDIIKARGKLTLEEIEDTLRYGEDNTGAYIHGHYVIILKCAESTCGGSGIFDLGGEPSGDAVELIPIYQEDDCPVCRKLLPPFRYCPSCLRDWDVPLGQHPNDYSKEVKKIREEAKETSGA